MQTVIKRSSMFTNIKNAMGVTTSYRNFNVHADDKRGEKGAEKSYFSKNDAMLLKKLAEKMQVRDEQETLGS